MSYFKNNGTNYTQVLAEYAANLTYDKIPAEVIERAKPDAFWCSGNSR